jgi:Na+-driven multidrug efflux pump
VQALAVEYFRARVMAAPFWYGFVVLRGYYQARGDMHAPMKLNMFANGINVPLDLAMVPLGWLLGVWLELGALGAWLGITAQVVVLALLICGVFVRGRWASGGTLATRSDPAPRSSCCGAQDAPQRLDAVVAGGESSNCA